MERVSPTPGPGHDASVMRRADRHPWTPDIDDAGAGYDTFGANADWARRVAIFNSILYERWFRVRAYGAEHIPQRGAGILVANHSGNFPLDGAMIWTDVLRRTRPPRLVRPIAHNVVPAMPLVSILAARIGVVAGTRTNVERLLSRGELLLIFPEGVPGIIKAFSERYKLREFTVGHAEFAIRHRVPIYPMAVIGAEEQWPALGTIPFGRSRLQRIAVPALPLPLPVRYHLHYGPPLHIYADHPPECADVPEVLEACAARVRGVVQSMVDEGLRQRKGVFA
jgi:1-acyl-sn-glycerol-3-phosphate acyltransferase